MVSGFEFLDLLQGILPGRFSLTACRQGQTGAIAGSAELGGHQQDLVTQGLKRGGLQFWGQATALEPIDEVVGQQEQMEVGLVGEEVAHGNAAQARSPL